MALSWRSRVREFQHEQHHAWLPNCERPCYRIGRGTIDWIVGTAVHAISHHLVIDPQTEFMARSGHLLRRQTQSFSTEAWLRLADYVERNEALRMHNDFGAVPSNQTLSPNRRIRAVMRPPGEDSRSALDEHVDDPLPKYGAYNLHRQVRCI